MPKYATFFLVTGPASIGLPLMNGFIGEFLVLSGAFQARPIYGILGATGIIWSAGYLLVDVSKGFLRQSNARCQ